MKLKNIITAISTFFFIGVMVVLINGCKKEDKNNSANNLIEADDLTFAKQAVAQMIRENGKSIVVPVNQNLEYFYVSAKTGNLISRAELLKNRPVTNGVHSNSKNGTEEDFVSACNYDPYTTQLTSYTLTENCLNSPNSFQISFTFQIWTDDNLVLTNPVSHRSTVGYLKLYNGSTLVYSNLTITPPTFSTPVADPSNPGYYYINVTFTSPWLPSSYFAINYSANLGGLLQTDCGDAETTGIALYTPTSLQYPSTNPCNRIDPVYPVDNSSTKTIITVGEDAGLNCTGVAGFVYPYWQEVKYSIDGGTYTNTLLKYSSSNCLFTNFLNSFYVDPVGAGTLNLNYSTLPTGTHTINFMYRNHYYTQTKTPIGCNAGQNIYPLLTSTLPSGWADCAGAWSAPKLVTVTR